MALAPKRAVVLGGTVSVEAVVLGGLVLVVGGGGARRVGVRP